MLVFIRISLAINWGMGLLENSVFLSSYGYFLLLYENGAK